MRRLTCAVAIALMTCSTAHAQNEQDQEQPLPRWGEITYPLAGNLRREAGTVLCRFRIEEPPHEAPGAWYQPEETWYRFIVLRLNLAEDRHITLFQKSTKPHSRMWTAIQLPGGVPNLIDKSRQSSKWQAGSTHVIGYTWNREGEHIFWIDGEPVDRGPSDAPSQGLGPIDAANATLSLGHQVGMKANGSAIAVLGVHTLEAPLDEEMMQRDPAALFEQHDTTLLLDRFDNENFDPNGERETTAEVISRFTGERGGVPTKHTRFVETPDGPALRLYTPPAGTEISY